MMLFQNTGKQALQMNYPEYECSFYDCIDSTNLECQRKWQERPKKYLVLADRQTSGRGRYGRSWQSEPETNVYISWVQENPYGANGIGYLNLLCGIALYDAIFSLYGDFDKRMTLKWPNDLYIGPQKMAGILLQSLDPLLEYVVIGMGINVYASAGEMPETGTSISLEKKIARENERMKIVCALLRYFAPDEIGPYRIDRNRVLSNFWKRARLTRETCYRYTSLQYHHEGILHRLDENCTVEIKTPSGEVIHLSN